MALPSMTLSELREAVRQRADLPATGDDGGFVTDSELNSYVNNSLFELYDVLVSAYGEDYYATTSTISTNGTSETYALPDDFYKLLGVDLYVSAPNNYVSLLPFPFAERNAYGLPNVQTMVGSGTNLRYRIRANRIWFQPLAIGGQTIRLLYVPRMMPLIAPWTVTFDGVVAGDTITFTTSIGAYELVADNEFNVGSTDAETAENFAAAVVLGAPASTDGWTAVASDNVVSMTQTTEASIPVTSDDSLELSSATFTYGPYSSDGFSGWLDYAVVDSCIKVMVKQEDDPRAFMSQKAEILKRIEAMAANRDAGNPERVSDIYATGGNIINGNGWGGW